MTGIIEGAKAPAPAENKVSPQAVRSQMKLPPEVQGTYEKVVAAGKKILYSQQMDEQIRALLQGPGDIGQKLGQGVVLLMALLIDKSNGTMPPNVIIPAATELVAEAGQFLRDAGMKVSDADIAEGMGVMVEEILQRSGVSMDQLPQMLQGQGAPAEA